MPLDTLERLRAKHRVKTNEPSRSLHSLPAVVNVSSSSTMSSLMFDLLSRTSAVTVNVANVASSADVGNTGRPVTASQAPLPTVTVSSSNDVTLSAVVSPVSHRSTRHQRESILHYMPALTSREAQSRPLCDSRSLALHNFISFAWLFLGRLFDRVDLIKPVSNARSYVRAYLRLSTKSFFDFSEIWHVGR